MRILKKVLLFPIRLVLKLINLLLDLCMRIESLIAGLGGLFLLASIIYSVKNQFWSNVVLLVIALVLGVVFLLVTAELKVWVEIILEKTK